MWRVKKIKGGPMSPKMKIQYLKEQKQYVDKLKEKVDLVLGLSAW